MAFPSPVPGLVIRSSYLRASEHARGREEGIKERPAGVILVTTSAAGEPMVTVLPITCTPPGVSALAVQIPHPAKRRLGLDDAWSWVVLTEANRFAWPGPDARPASGGDAASVAYGPLPYALFEEIRLKFIAAVKARAARTVPRTA